MFAWTGQVTQGKLALSVEVSPAAMTLESLGIHATSCARNAGIERNTTRAAVMRGTFLRNPVGTNSIAIDRGSQPAGFALPRLARSDVGQWAVTVILSGCR